jgi:hypothetical protein
MKFIQEGGNYFQQEPKHTTTIIIASMCDGCIRLACIIGVEG